jgi:Arc/MetJ family transcription regulator
MLMAYTRGINEDALAEAMRLSGAKTKKETVNVALREFAARHRRIAGLEHYATLAAGWELEGWEHRRAAEKADLRHGRQHDLVVLHDDKDFATAARFIPDVRERSIRDAPQAG